MRMTYIVGIIIFILFMLAANSKREEDNLRNEGLIPPADQPCTDEQIEMLLQRGHKIQAIKLYRQTHNVGLKEAKEAVEKFDGQRNPK